MKILYVITKSNWGGAQRYVFNLASALAQTHTVTVALGGTGLPGADTGLLSDKLRDFKIRTILVRNFLRDISLGAEFAAYRELLEIFRTEKPDIVHLNSSKAGGLGALAARVARVPKIIFTSHGLAYDEDRNIFSRVFIYLATLATFILSHSVIVISKDSYKRAKNLPFCSKKINLIHNGITPITRFETQKDARSKIGLEVEPKTIVVGTIAEFTRNKGLEYLVRSVGILSRQNYNVALSIIGDGDQKKSIENLGTKENIRLHSPGFIPNAYLYLKAFDIFALTSIKEGLPYVLLEAGQAKLACLGSRIPGIEDIIDDKKDGILVEPKNPLDIARGIKEIIDQAYLREMLGHTLKNKIEKEFSTTEMIEKTVALYHS